MVHNCYFGKPLCQFSPFLCPGIAIDKRLADEGLVGLDSTSSKTSPQLFAYQQLVFEKREEKKEAPSLLLTCGTRHLGRDLEAPTNNRK